MSFKYPVIDMRATGAHIKELMNTREVTVQDVQEAMGLASPQAVYRCCVEVICQAWTIYTHLAGI